MRQLSCCLRLLLLGGLPLLVGCSPTTPPSVSEGKPTPRLRTASSPLPVSSAQTALASVQSLPLYHQAQQACQAGQFRHASDLLAQLASSASLSAEQRAFVQEQRNLCLHDAGLPLVPRKEEEKKRRREEEEVQSTIGNQQSTIHNRQSALASDCGPRALLLLCEQRGVKTTLPQLRQLAGTTREGTSLEGLARAAKQVGLKAEGVQVSREALAEVNMPAIAYVNGNHFLVVLSVQGRGENATARIHDPNEAQEETISQERLLRLCSGYLLLVSK